MTVRGPILLRLVRHSTRRNRIATGRTFTKNSHERRGSLWQASLAQQCGGCARLHHNPHKKERSCVVAVLHTSWQPREYAWTLVNTASNGIKFVNEKGLPQFPIAVRTKTGFKKDDTYFFNAMVPKIHMF